MVWTATRKTRNTSYSYVSRVALVVQRPTTQIARVGVAKKVGQVVNVPGDKMA